MSDAKIGTPEACIVGWAHSPFGKLDEPDLESLLARVGRAAIEDAGIEPAEVDAGFVGVFGEGFTPQGFPSSLVLQSVPELRFKPLTRFENACATGSAAVHGALDFLAAGRGRFALVLGAEKMTATPGPKIGDILLSASYRRTEQDIEGGFAGVFARIAESDMFLMPDLATFNIIPWERGRNTTAQVVCWVYKPNGELFMGDPRAVLSTAQPIESSSSVGRFIQSKAAAGYRRLAVTAKIDGEDGIAETGQPGCVVFHRAA